MSERVAYVLKFLAGKTPGVEFPLEPFEHEIVIGRTDVADLVLEDVMVSRKHARIVREHGQFVLEDLGSTNGVFVNAQRVKRARLELGDRIQIGSTLLKLIHAESQLTSSTEPTAYFVPEPDENGAAAVPAGQDMSRFGGIIDEIPMLDLVQLLSTSKKSGLLEVRSLHGYGCLCLRGGQITHAAVGHPPAVTGPKAVYRMLGWQSGQFELRPADGRTFGAEIQASTDALLLEAMHQLDEIARLRNLLPPLHLRLIIAKPLPPPDGLTDEQIEVLKLIYGTPRISVSTVLDRCDLPDLETYQTLIYLARARYITVAQGPGDTPPRPRQALEDTQP